jgi:deazaflavin-dependent oxidoreductase (nitroreductase family)
VAAIPAVDPTSPPGPLERVMRRFVMSDAGTRLAMTMSARVDPVLLKMSRGRVSTGIAFPVVLLTVTGRRSGVERTVPLVYFTQGSDVVLVASSFGRSKHPAWYLNIKANPEVTLTSGGRSGRYRAREAEGAERDRLFALAEQLYAGYGLYAARAGRVIPVLVLSPL